MKENNKPLRIQLPPFQPDELPLVVIENGKKEIGQGSGRDVWLGLVVILRIRRAELRRTAGASLETGLNLVASPIPEHYRKLVSFPPAITVCRIL